LSSVKLLFRIASFLNTLTLILPWWSRFEIYNRIQSDAFLFGFLKYRVDTAPNMWQYPSSGAPLLFEKWPDTYQPFMLITMMLVCLGSLCYIKASMMSNGTCRTGITGCLFSTGALIIFIHSVVSINESGGFVGVIPTPSWIDWGPDIGFFLILFSTTIALISLISKLKALRLRIHVTFVTRRHTD